MYELLFLVLFFLAVICKQPGQEPPDAPPTMAMMPPPPIPPATPSMDELIQQSQWNLQQQEQHLHSLRQVCHRTCKQGMAMVTSPGWTAPWVESGTCYVRFLQLMYRTWFV